MMMKKTVNLFLAGSFLAAASASFAQPAPGSQPSAPPAGAAQQQQRQAPLPGEAQADRQDPAALEAKMEEIRDEVREISVRLNNIHQEALLEEDVRQSLIEYETTFNEKVRDSAPGLEPQVEAHAEVIKQLSAVGENGEDIGPQEEQELRALLDQYSEVKQQLAPLENQLLNDQELVESRMEYQEELLSAMNEVDPKVEEMIEKRMELAQSFMALQQEYLQSQQGAQGQQAPQPGAQAPQRRPGQ